MIEEPKERRTCIDCGVTSPVANTSHTLISKQGWRLIRVKGPNDEAALEWRCPVCWKNHRSRSGYPT
jgi:hypothetical protein